MHISDYIKQIIMHSLENSRDKIEVIELIKDVWIPSNQNMKYVRMNTQEWKIDISLCRITAWTSLPVLSSLCFGFFFFFSQ